MNPERAPISKGAVSPIRPVPASIPRPEYVGRKRAATWRGGDVHDEEMIGRIRVASRLAAQALAEVCRAVTPGITTDELDRIGHEFLCDNGAYPSTLLYPGGAGRPPFPKSLCASLNEVVCHGIPDSTVIQDGDIVKIDITAFKDGVHGDNCASVVAGEGSQEAHDLVRITREAQERGIAAVKPGREVNVIGRVIENYAKRHGCQSVRDYTGHGVGPAFHSGLVIPHYDSAPYHADIIEPGMTFTIEPMIVAGSEENHEWKDGWTVVTDDGSWCAQFEHTLLVTDDGAEVLTLP
ncbi:MAG: type I methionyl aminopeptidase [Demequinaceae bacterium]|nr:type I methionyl aminopeptidase [Demequinaceae bacterium]